METASQPWLPSQVGCCTAWSRTPSLWPGTAVSSSAGATQTGPTCPACQPVEESHSWSFDAAMPFMDATSCPVFDEATPSSETVSDPATPSPMFDEATPSSEIASEPATTSPETVCEEVTHRSAEADTSDSVLAMEEAEEETPWTR